MAASESKPRSHHEIGHQYILRAQFKEETRSLSLAYLAKKNRTPLSLVVIEGGVEESAVNCAKAWVEALMKAVYDGTLGSPPCRFQVLIFSDIGLKRSRRLMVFVNPYGGTVGAYPTTKQVYVTLPTLFLFRKKARLYSQKRLNLYSRSQGVPLRFYVSSHSSLLKNTQELFSQIHLAREKHTMFVRNCLSNLMQLLRSLEMDLYTKF